MIKDGRETEGRGIECRRRTGIILTHSGEGDKGSVRRAAQSGWSEERATDRNLHPAFHPPLPTTLCSKLYLHRQSHHALRSKYIQDAAFEIRMSGGETGDREPAQVQRHSPRRARGPALHMKRAKGTKPEEPQEAEEAEEVL
ncbi:hypothetical protein V501_09667 [Pseudogymnoascus sp. VKM F-4519 (FW-2642)]|nr:hypothetical protein V501_09667 [Pseudogymnoascus sp. VKM F-4519 (FW-2642)]